MAPGCRASTCADLHQLFGRLQLAPGQAGDGADHRLVAVDVPDLDIGDLDAPGVGMIEPARAAGLLNVTPLRFDDGGGKGHALHAVDWSQ